MFEAMFWNSEHVFDKAETLSREILFFGHLLTIARFDLGTRLKGETVTNIPAGIYFLKVNNRNTRTRCEICSKLTNRLDDGNQQFYVNLISKIFNRFPAAQCR